MLVLVVSVSASQDSSDHSSSGRGSPAACSAVPPSRRALRSPVSEMERSREERCSHAWCERRLAVNALNYQEPRGEEMGQPCLAVRIGGGGENTHEPLAPTHSSLRMKVISN